MSHRQQIPAVLLFYGSFYEEAICVVAPLMLVMGVCGMLKADDPASAPPSG